ncbi:citrate lyase beta subunit [Ramaria rubella]|nr:citrate lyase beta subunit [Ramaria rubella]
MLASTFRYTSRTALGSSSSSCLASLCRILTGRTYSTDSSTNGSSRPQRAYLYVPSSSTRMLEKSITGQADTLIYDLEDSVAPSQKESARENLESSDDNELPHSERISVRINGVDTPFFRDDIAAIVKVSRIQTLVLPKVNSIADLDSVSQTISQCLSLHPAKDQIKLIASIESARSLWSLGEIATWKSGEGVASISALLFAAEDFCADTSIIRTQSRQELLYPRSKIVLAAKAFQLQAIDMVCVNYKDMDTLREECEEGRRLGFNGKQAIHPNQVELIQSTFVPTEKEIKRAVTILHQMRLSHASSKGAFGLDLSDGKGGKEMIDAPMLKQAESTIRVARAAGLEVPSVA